MDNLSHFPKTIHGYLELLADHTRTKKEPSPWPGDAELLAVYNVTPDEILESLNKKITEANILHLIEKGCESLIEVDLNGHYKITADIKILTESKASVCTYCKVAFLSEWYFKIYNLKNNLELILPAPILHLLEHDDLGDTLALHIDPTIACKVLELGNTTLETSNPLYNVAQFGKSFFITLT